MLIDIISGSHYVDNKEVSIVENITVQGFAWTDLEEDFSDYCLRNGRDIGWKTCLDLFLLFCPIKTNV